MLFVPPLPFYSVLRNNNLTDEKTPQKGPMCRSPSNFIIPSSRPFDTGPAKTKFVAEYRATLQRIRCRFLETCELKHRRLICPFGDDCFYSHAVPFPAGPPLKLGDMAEARRLASVERLVRRQSRPRHRHGARQRPNQIAEDVANFAEDYAAAFWGNAFRNNGRLRGPVDLDELAALEDLDLVDEMAFDFL